MVQEATGLNPCGPPIDLNSNNWIPFSNQGRLKAVLRPITLPYA